MKVKALLALGFSLFYLVLLSQSWREIALPISYAVLDGAFKSNTANVIAGDGYIIHTDDYFQTYNIDSDYKGQTAYGISFPSKDIGFISAGWVRGGILKTIDGGTTWNPLSSGPQGGLNAGDVIQFLNTDTGFGVFNSDGYLNIMYDTGLITSEANVGYHCVTAREIWFLNTKLGYILCSVIGDPEFTYSSLFNTVNGGYTWQLIANIGQAGTSDFCMLDDSTMLYVSTISNIVLKSTNAGRTFDTVLVETDSVSTSVHHAIAFAVHDTGYITLAEHVYRSIDAGNTWTLTDFVIDTDSDKIVFLRSASANQAIVGTNRGRLYITDNGGGTATGINNISNSGELGIYPNPAKDFLQAYINATTSKADLQITTIARQCLRQINVAQRNHFTLDVSQLAPGIYFLSLQSENERVVRKFVKQ